MSYIFIKATELSGISKIIGLIGKNSASSVFFKTRFGIHTFGLKFPIDVLILDEKDSVVYLKKNLKMNRVFIWNPRFKKVIELPAGFADKNKIKRFDIIEIK